MKLKICGVQSVDQARKLAEMGVDLIGLNFVPTSARHVDFDKAKAIAESLEELPAQVVALFQDQPLELVQAYTAEIRPAYIQLHGTEDSEFIAALNLPVIKSIVPGQKTESVLADYYLLDRAERGMGPAINLAAAEKLVSSNPGRIFLAGGLAPDNLDNILNVVKPFAVDIAGGVRTNDVIDFSKVKTVLRIIRRQS